MRGTFALIVCSHAVASAAAGMQLGEVAGTSRVGVHTTAFAGMHAGASAESSVVSLDGVLGFDPPMHVTIDHATGRGWQPAPAARAVVPTARAPVHGEPSPSSGLGMIGSFDIATFSESEPQASQAVEFTTASAIPAPASLVLIALGGLIALRR